MTRQNQFMTGERLGKWVIFKELGRGGMGQVFLGQEELTGRQAAVKVLAGELAQSIGFLHRFQREIEALSRLDHPGIVRFYESGQENAKYFYAMEYVDGQSLDEILIAQGALPWPEVLDIALQICPALRHVHDNGIIHRDIKPPNILRTHEGVIKLTDFGIAKVFAGEHLTATGGVVGTAEFLSPEQASGKPVSKRSDLYSLGVVLYTLLTGKTPFSGASYLDLLHKHRYGQFDPPRRINPKIPFEVDELVCSLLEKDPDKRPPDCLVLGKQLDSIRRKLERQNLLTIVGTTPSQTVDEKQGTFELEPPAGPATLMGKLMRAELERGKALGPVSRLLNRVWILVPLLALCIALIVWAFWPLSMETLYSRGAKLMASERLADMQEGWRDYLEPLNKRFPDHPYQKEVEQFKLTLQTAEAGNTSEARRLFQRGEKLSQEGNLKEAQRVWQNIIVIFKNMPAEQIWVRRAEQALADQEKNAPVRWLALKPALDRADQLREQGQRAEAEKIWASLEEMYRDDPWAGPLLQQIAQARQK
jgi:tetratricopeptide (TPR) repeat protein